ncbi:DNA protecting protein DprA [Candidatus Giovannonibacteria bacterium RIFCSPLOWO2_01_FULL_46_32]|uniref:DNA protecting protein DprA n=1 Tax=Candidatus Giovannonibacteria bacterium RIFCSPLOWO2_01_FULL_46_32 TaxID=1798353 RepID=A0A1F5XI81_9BACT|nr:MAG: DNA protecting protein DprA [Candidatus Giovannonibacteria bacterium RIFCSPLOWO2_01_FULL_46_32]
MAENINEIKIGSAAYPEALKEIPFPPKKISLWSSNGQLPTSNFYISIVGTRRSSAYGEEILRKIIAGLAPYGFATVSGMATGIDTIVAKASLENKIQTIAVLGSGLSKEAFYPPKNWTLAEKIVEAGGAVLSEYERDMKATLWSFPQRNRIISGLSPATLVVEAPEKSGALITAKFALDQNRDVLAIPGSAFSANSAGTNRLIKQGAALVESAEDVLRAYGIDLAVKPPSGGLTALADLSPEEKIIFELMAEPADIDTLIRKSKMPSHAAQSVIGLLEIRGIIKKIGNEYIKIFK